GARAARTSTRREIQLRECGSLLRGGHQLPGAIELIDDLKYVLVELRAAQLAIQYPANAQVQRRPLLLGDERIDSLLNPVVHEPILPADEHEMSCRDGFAQCLVNGRPGDLQDSREQGNRGATPAKAREALQGPESPRR